MMNRPVKSSVIQEKSISALFRREDALRLIFCTFLLSVIAAPMAEADDFRDFRWGATPQDVINREGTNTIFAATSTSPSLMYAIKNGPGSDYQSSIGFIFHGDTLPIPKLDEGRYENIRRRTGSQDSAGTFIEDFEYFAETLTSKYGEPSEKSKNHKMAVTKLLPDKLALIMRWLTLQNTWLTQRSLIIQTLQKDNLGFSHTIRYVDRSAIDRKAKEQKEFNEFLDAAQKGHDPSVKKDL